MEARHGASAPEASTSIMLNGRPVLQTRAVLLQAWWRGVRDRRRVRRLRAAVRTQAHVRGWQARRRVAAVRAAVAMQSVWRGVRGRRVAARARAAVMIQKSWRGYAVRIKMGWQT